MNTSSIRAGLVGASGYGGAELARLLSAHPFAHVAAATASGERIGQKLSDLFPSLRTVCDIELEAFGADLLARKCDVVFFSLPHGKTFEMVPPLLERGVKVIDIGADFRLRDATEYEQWYKLEHGAAALLGEAVYGLPEWNREKIKGARLVGNPGCFPTAAVLALAPFVASGKIEFSSIIVDAASGTSGAGRSSFGLGLHHAEIANDFKAYNVAAHRHTPEIEQALRDAAESTVEFDRTQLERIPINFTAHLLPVARGILATCYANLTADLTTGQAVEILKARYENEPFVRVHDAGSLPQIAHVVGSNFCDIGAVVDERTGRVIVVSAIDNLIKGAAGQAMQNMNILFDLPETAGLLGAPVFP